jgi:hypothetical protein
LDDGFGEDVRLFHADAFEDEDDEGSLYWLPDFSNRQ